MARRWRALALAIASEPYQQHAGTRSQERASALAGRQCQSRSNSHFGLPSRHGRGLGLYPPLAKPRLMGDAPVMSGAKWGNSRRSPDLFRLALMLRRSRLVPCLHLIGMDLPRQGKQSLHERGEGGVQAGFLPGHGYPCAVGSRHCACGNGEYEQFFPGQVKGRGRLQRSTKRSLDGAEQVSTHCLDWRVDFGISREKGAKCFQESEQLTASCWHLAQQLLCCCMVMIAHISAPSAARQEAREDCEWPSASPKHQCPARCCSCGSWTRRLTTSRPGFLVPAARSSSNYSTT